MTITNKTVHGAAAAVSAALLVLYLFTLAPSVSFIDAGELAAVAHTFGIAHPTGYPTFTMLAGLWTKLPLGDGITRLNILSAVLAAVATGILTHVLWFLLGMETRRKPVKGKGKVQRPSGQMLHPEQRLALSIFGALSIGLSETFWKTALSIEVYALHLPMLAAVIWLFITAQFDTTIDESRRARRWLLFAFALGLSFTNHMTTMLVLPAFLIVHFRAQGFGAATWKRIGRMLPAFAIGLLPYLYLPLRAASAPALNWGNPSTLENLFRHVSGKQYRVWIFASMDAAKRQFTQFVSTLPAEFAYAGIALAVIGIYAAFRRDSRAGLLLILLFIGCVGYAVNYDIHDIDSYFLLAYIVAGIWVAYGLHAVLGWFRALSLRTFVPVAALLLGLFAGVQYSGVSERGNYLVEDYTKNMLQSFEKNALVLSFQWDYWVSASYYYQLVERLRPDVVVIDKELLRRSWYLAQLRQNHPDIAARSRAEIDAFLEDLSLFERDAPYDAARIEERFNAMINSFVERNITDRPVYLTYEIEKHLAPGYQRVPEGLAFRLYREGQDVSADDTPHDDFRIRPFERRDRLSDALIVMYPVMLTNRGIWLHEKGLYDAAGRYFDRALDVDPGYSAAAQWKAKNDAARSVSALRGRMHGTRG